MSLVWRGVLAAGLCCLGCARLPAAETIHVAVAANFISTARELGQRYTETHGVDIRFSSASTGKLYAQIRNGLPADLFLAADQHRPRLLSEEGFAVAGSQWTYAIGELVFWAPGEMGDAEHCHDWLAQARPQRLALANPRTAPYGAAALVVLQSMKLEEALRPRFVQGENIAQTYLFVDSGAAPAGFVARSQIVRQGRSRDATGRGCQWLPPAHRYPELRQDGVVLRKAQGRPQVRAFVGWLRSSAADALIRGAGYRLP